MTADDAASAPGGLTDRPHGSRAPNRSLVRRHWCLVILAAVAFAVAFSTAGAFRATSRHVGSTEQITVHFTDCGPDYPNSIAGFRAHGRFWTSDAKTPDAWRGKDITGTVSYTNEDRSSFDSSGKTVSFSGRELPDDKFAGVGCG